MSKTFKTIILTLFATAAVGFTPLQAAAKAPSKSGTAAAQAPATETKEVPKLFPYPEPPKTMTNLYDRSSFLTYNFWEKCNFSNAFAHPDQLAEAVGDWVACMPYAAPDTVSISIERIIERVCKKSDQLVTFADMVRSTVFTDKSEYYSEFIMLPFAKAVTEHKKVKKDDRKRFENIVTRIESSQVGKIAHPIELTFASDSIHAAVPAKNLGEIATDNLLLFFYEPDNMDVMMARARLSADPTIGALIGAGKLDILAIYPGAPDEKWAKSTLDFPSNWMVAASPEADLYFDREDMPTIYYLGKNHDIRARKVNVNNIVDAFTVLRYQNLSEKDQEAKGTGDENATKPADTQATE